MCGEGVFAYFVQMDSLARIMPSTVKRDAKRLNGIGNSSPFSEPAFATSRPSPDSEIGGSRATGAPHARHGHVAGTLRTLHASRLHAAAAAAVVVTGPACRWMTERVGKYVNNGRLSPLAFAIEAQREIRRVFRGNENTLGAIFLAFVFASRSFV